MIDINLMKPSWNRFYFIDGPKSIGGFEVWPYITKKHPIRMLLEQDIFI